MVWAPVRRTIAAVFAAWSFVVQEEPAALHTCALHDGVAHEAGSAALGVSHAASSDTGTHHAAGTAPAATRHGNDRHHSGCCTCPGPCCDASPVALAETGAALAPPAIRPATRFAVRHTTYIPSDPEHSRPPSVGPPAPHIG
ncbi:MAG TPA: hypothetical protein VFW03_27570 [Gemmatimonadaceae bacterium]|nr:hypothetical protein [Gemmatimonadaceae bacterium]